MGGLGGLKGFSGLGGLSRIELSSGVTSTASTPTSDGVSKGRSSGVKFLCFLGALTFLGPIVVFSSKTFGKCVRLIESQTDKVDYRRKKSHALEKTNGLTFRGKGFITIREGLNNTMTLGRGSNIKEPKVTHRSS